MKKKFSFNKLFNNNLKILLFVILVKKDFLLLNLSSFKMLF